MCGGSVDWFVETYLTSFPIPPLLVIIGCCMMNSWTKSLISGNAVRKDSIGSPHYFQRSPNPNKSRMGSCVCSQTSLDLPSFSFTLFTFMSELCIFQELQQPNASLNHNLNFTHSDH